MDRSQPMLGSLLETLVSGIRAVLGGDLVGIYLYGSAVSGGFDQGVSDTDLVVVTAPEVEAIDLAGLDRMQLDVINRNLEWRDRLEVVYIGWTTLQSFRTSPGSLAVISPGEPFHVVGDVAEWLQNWYLVRETGVTLHGVAPSDVIPPITSAEYVAAVRRYAGWLGDRNYDDAGPRVSDLCGPVPVPRAPDCSHRPTLLEAGGGGLGVRTDARMGLAHRRGAPLSHVPRDDRLRRRADAHLCAGIHRATRSRDREP